MHDEKEKDKNKDIDKKDQIPEDYKMKLNFFKRFWFSITKIEMYPLLSATGMKKALMYFAGLVMILAMVFSLGIIYELNSFVDGGKEYFENEFPELKYENEMLVVDSEEPIYFENENFLIGNIIVDTTQREQKHTQQIYFEDEELSNGSTIVIAFDQILIKNSEASAVISYRYADLFGELNIETFNKQDIIEYINSSQIIGIYTTIFFILLIYGFMLYFIINILNVIFLSILGYLTTILTRIKMKYRAIFNMTVYATTLSITLNVIYIGINIFVDFNIEYFQVMYLGVASIYLIAAIFMLKTEVIKKQMELVKIAEVQEQIKKEIEEKEQEEKVITEKPKKKKQEKGKTKKEEEDDNGDSEEPKANEV